MASAGPTPRDQQSEKITTAEAKAILALGMNGVGAKLKTSGLQGKQGKKAKRPEPQPRWRTMTDHAAVRFYAGWSVECFETAKRSAEESLGHASGAEAETLRAAIQDFSDHLERIAA